MVFHSFYWVLKGKKENENERKGFMYRNAKKDLQIYFFPHSHTEMQNNIYRIMHHFSRLIFSNISFSSPCSIWSKRYNYVYLCIMVKFCAIFGQLFNLWCKIINLGFSWCSQPLAAVMLASQLHYNHLQYNHLYGHNECIICVYYGL